MTPQRAAHDRTDRRRGRRRRVVVAAVAVAVTLLAAAGCARLPTSGPVMTAAEAENKPESGLEYLAAPPKAGASPEDIVAGFLQAGVAPASDYEVARAFLTSDLAATWDPTENAQAVSDAPAVAFDGVKGASASIDVEATVGADGSYSRLASTERRDVKFELRVVDGEWRIERAPNGVVLLEEHFTKLYKPYTLYFFDADYSQLVPDVRWLPDYAQTPRDIVRRLLAGPTTWLREGGVTSAFPADTAFGTVNVTEGRADVDFPRSFPSADPTMYSRIGLQLQKSLVGVAGIEEVGVSFNGSAVDLKPMPEPALPERNAFPIVYQDGVVGVSSGTDELTPLEGADGLADRLAELRPTRGVVSSSTRQGAFLTSAGAVAIGFESGEVTQLAGTFDQITPSIDREGYVWTASETGPAIVAQHVQRDTVEQLQVPGYAGEGVVALEVSPEGARVAMLVKDQGTLRLIVMAIERNADGAPVGLAPPTVMTVDSNQGVDLAWADPITVATLVDVGNGMTGVSLQQIGGNRSDAGQVARGTQVAGAKTVPGLRVLDALGNVYTAKSSRWDVSRQGVTFLVKQA